MMQHAIKKQVHNWIAQLRNNKLSAALVSALLVALLGWGGWKAWSWHVASKEGAAQLMFSQALDEYGRVLYAAKNETAAVENWEDSLLAFRTLQESYPRSSYALYAQAFQADIQARQGNLEDAVTTLEQVLSQLTQKSPVYYVFKTKIALLLMDTQQSAQGLAQLEALAADTSNPERDTAAFFAGYYYWTLNQFDAARKAWDYFDQTQSQDSQAVSPWSAIVRLKLAQIA